MAAPKIILHGGAGGWEKNNHPQVLESMLQAVQVGWQILQNGGSALDSVEAATIILEDNPLFDAGYGSFLTDHGEVEMDALIVDGTVNKFGAVASVKQIKNPITLARRVMTDSRHCFFVGEGAERYAVSLGIPLVANLSFVTDEEFAAFIERQQQPTFQGNGRGTVGAVALDHNGNIATATSTGGSPNKKQGRVGDVPIFGAGGYANSRFGGASATGVGENIMRHFLTKHVVDLIASGAQANSAAIAGVNLIEENISPSEVGVIVIDADGNLGASHTTAYMPVSWIDESGSPHTSMQKPYFESL